MTPNRLTPTLALCTALLMGFPAYVDAPNRVLRGVHTQFWVRDTVKLADNKGVIYKLEPVLMPVLYISPLEGQGIPVLERMGGIIECQEVYHIVHFKNEREGEGKVTLLECGGELFELKHFQFQPKDAAPIHLPKER